MARRRSRKTYRAPTGTNWVLNDAIYWPVLLGLLGVSIYIAANSSAAMNNPLPPNAPFGQ